MAEIASELNIREAQVYVCRNREKERLKKQFRHEIEAVFADHAKPRKAKRGGRAGRQQTTAPEAGATTSCLPDPGNQ